MFLLLVKNVNLNFICFIKENYDREGIMFYFLNIYWVMLYNLKKKCNV